jgi:antitoxin YefM
LNAVIDDKEVVIIKCRGGESAALIAADELTELTEAVHMLRSPASAERLLRALARAMKGEGERRTIEELTAEVGLSE